MMGFWDTSNWARPYGWRPPRGARNPYRLGYHIAQDVSDKEWLGPVPALRAGTVAEAGRQPAIGGYVALQVAPHEFDIYCHLYTEDVPRVGQRVEVGGDMPRLARGGVPTWDPDYPGSAWTGPHLHFVVSTRPDGAYNIREGDYRDPAPIIHSALAQLTALAVEEEDMIESLYTPFDGAQAVSGPALIFIKPQHVSVAMGPAKHVSGDLTVRLRGGVPYASSVQITPLVEEYVDGKRVSSHSLGAVEIPITPGDTFGQVTVNCGLGDRDRLRFRIDPTDAGEIEVVNAVFRGLRAS